MPLGQSIKLLRNLLLGLAAAVGLLLIVLRFTPLGTLLLGAAQAQRFSLPPGNLAVPHECTTVWTQRSVFADTILQSWAAKPLGDWQTAGKGNAPRVLLARFVARAQLAEANQYLQALRPWGTSGSRWALHQGP